MSLSLQSVTQNCCRFFTPVSVRTKSYTMRLSLTPLSFTVSSRMSFLTSSSGARADRRPGKSKGAAAGPGPAGPAPMFQGAFQVRLGLVRRHQPFRLQINQFFLEDAQPSEVALRQQQFETTAARIQRQHSPEGRLQGAETQVGRNDWTLERGGAHFGGTGAGARAGPSARRWSARPRAGPECWEWPPRGPEPTGWRWSGRQPPGPGWSL